MEIKKELLEEYKDETNFIEKIKNSIIRLLVRLGFQIKVLDLYEIPHRFVQEKVLYLGNNKLFTLNKGYITRDFNEIKDYFLLEVKNKLRHSKMYSQSLVEQERIEFILNWLETNYNDEKECMYSL